MNNAEMPNPFDEDPPSETPYTYGSSSLSPVEEDNSGRRIIWLILGVAAIGCGFIFTVAFFLVQPNTQSLVSQFFQSPTPNLTATQQVLNNSTSTAQALQSTLTSVANTQRILLTDAFDSNKKGWGTISSKDALAKTIINIADGKYVWDITTFDLNITEEKASQKSLADFTLSVDAKQISGPSTADYGIFFRENADLYAYYFMINDDGEYVLQLYNNEWTNLINYTKSDLIHPGEANRITVIAEGSHFTFLINGQYLTEFTDQRMKAGQVGLTTTLYDANQHAIFEFDNFELRAP